MMTQTVAIVGLGSIGFEVVKALDRGIAGLKLIAVADCNLESARAKTANLAVPPALGDLESLGSADIIVEAAAASALPSVIDLATRNKRTVVVCSVGGLLASMELVERAAAGGAR